MKSADETCMLGARDGEGELEHGTSADFEKVKKAHRDFETSGGDSKCHMGFLQVATVYFAANPTNCWCLKKELMTEMLYVYTLEKKTRELLDFEAAVEQQLERCADCVTAYHLCQEHFVKKYTDSATAALVWARFLEHDKRRILRALQPNSGKKVRQLACFEIFCSTKLYACVELQDSLTAAVNGEPTASFGLLELEALPLPLYLALFHPDSTVMKWSRNMIRTAGKQSGWYEEAGEMLRTVGFIIERQSAASAAGSAAIPASVGIDSRFPVTDSCGEIFKSVRQWLSALDRPAATKMLHSYPKLVEHCTEAILSRSHSLWTLCGLLEAMLITLGNTFWQFLTPFPANVEAFLNLSLLPDMSVLDPFQPLNVELRLVLMLLYTLAFGHSEALHMLSAETGGQHLLAKMQTNLLDTCFLLLNAIRDKVSVKVGLNWAMQQFEDASATWKGHVMERYRQNVLSTGRKFYEQFPKKILGEHVAIELSVQLRVDDKHAFYDCQAVVVFMLLLDDTLTTLNKEYRELFNGEEERVNGEQLRGLLSAWQPLLTFLAVDQAEICALFYKSVVEKLARHSSTLCSLTALEAINNPFKSARATCVRKGLSIQHSILLSILSYAKSSQRILQELDPCFLLALLFTPNLKVTQSSLECLERLFGVAGLSLTLRTCIVLYPQQSLINLQWPIKSLSIQLSKVFCPLDCLAAASTVTLDALSALELTVTEPSENYLFYLGHVVCYGKAVLEFAYYWGFKQLDSSEKIADSASTVISVLDRFVLLWARSWFSIFEKFTKPHLQVSIAIIDTLGLLIKWFKVKLPELLKSAYSLATRILGLKFYFGDVKTLPEELEQRKSAVVAEARSRLLNSKLTLSQLQVDQLLALFSGTSQCQPQQDSSTPNLQAVTDLNRASNGDSAGVSKVARWPSGEMDNSRYPKSRRLEFSQASIDSIWKEQELASNLSANLANKKSFVIGIGNGALRNRELSAMEKLRYGVDATSKNGLLPNHGVNRGYANSLHQAGYKKTKTLEEEGYTYIRAPVMTAASIAAARQQETSKSENTLAHGSQTEDDAHDEMSCSDWLNMSHDASKARKAHAKGSASAPTQEVMVTKILDPTNFKTGAARAGEASGMGATNSEKRSELALELLHEKLLSWDPTSFLSAEQLSTELKKLMRNLRPVVNSYKHVRDYESVFEPLLVLELWEQMAQTMEALDSGEIGTTCELLELREVVAVDQFMDVVLLLKKQKSGFYQDHDIFLLYAKQHGEYNVKVGLAQQLEKAVQVFGKVQGITLNRQKQWEMTIRTRVNPQDYEKIAQLKRCLIPGNACLAGLPLLSLASVHREYNALAKLSYFPLFKYILNPKLIAPPKERSAASSEYSRIKKRMNLNEFQLSAIASAYESQHGFTLIQGPPGTGKTRTILALLALYLTKRRPTLIGAPNLPLTRVDGSASSGTVCVNGSKFGLLVCAPSNAAIDEIVRRLRSGVLDVNGKTVFPSVVRIGAPEAVHDDVRDILLDSLIEENLVETAQTVSGDLKSDSEKVVKLKESLKLLKDDISALKNDLFNTVDFAERDRLQSKLQTKQECKFQVIQQLDSLKQRKLNSRTLGEKLKLDIKKRILQRADVIASTLNASGHDVLRECGCKFETVIIDEAGQAVELSTLIPLQYGAKSCVLVGDINQLPPTVLSRIAQKNKYEQSLFQRISNVEPLHPLMLSMQYRMHPEISQLPSRLFYQGKLLNAEGLDQACSAEWHKSSPLLSPFRLFNVKDGVEATGRGHSVWNAAEALACVQLIQYLCTLNPKVCFANRIGVITPYSVQLSEIRKQLEKAFGPNVKRYVQVSTIDGFQGQEKDIIVFSTVRAFDAKGYSSGIGFLADERRMNVALTRAKRSLFVLGNAEYISQNNIWQQIVQNCKIRGLVTDYESKLTFKLDPYLCSKSDSNGNSPGFNLYPEEISPSI